MCAVVIDTETATNVNKLNVEAHLMKLYVKLCRLLQGYLYASDFRHLAADVIMHQLETVHHVVFLKKSKSFKQF